MRFLRRLEMPVFISTNRKLIVASASVAWRTRWPTFGNVLAYGVKCSDFNLAELRFNHEVTNRHITTR